ncbi:hypothetical protein BsWGS_29041 [Bradybaena similaris]
MKQQQCHKQSGLSLA